MTVPLVIIDVQKGFINEATAHVPERVAALQAGYGTIFATRFMNPENSAHRRLIGWQRFAPGSADTELAFAPAADTVVLEKSTYSATDTHLLARLRMADAHEVHLCGIATDNCVLAIALVLFEAGFRPVVLADACASHAGAEYHLSGIRILKRLIGAAQVVEGPAGGVVI